MTWKGPWKFNWYANPNLILTSWGIDSLCFFSMRKQMHRGFMVKMGLWDPGDLSCLLGSAGGLLQSLWLVLSSCIASVRGEYYGFFYLSAAKAGGKGFVDFSLLCCSMTGVLGYLDCKILKIFWLVGWMRRSPTELWVPGLCGDHLERWAGILKGETLKLRKFSICKITQQDLQKLLQDLPPPRVFITHSRTMLPRVPEQNNNNHPHTISQNNTMKCISRKSSKNQK